MRYPFILLVAFFVLGCSSQNEEQTVIPVVDLTERTEFKQSDFIESIEYISLEASEESLIGTINDVQFYEDRIYVLDATTEALKVFDSEGEYLFDIGQKGKGPGEYQNLSDFSIDVQTGEIYLLDWSKKIHVFDLDARYLRSIDLDFGANQIEVKGKYIYCYRNYSSTNDALWFNLITTDLEGNIIAKHLPYEPKGMQIIFSHPFSQTENSLWLLAGKDAETYEVPLEGAPVLKRELIFLGDKISSGEFPEDSKDFMEYIESHGNVTGPYIENDLFVMFHYIDQSNNWFVKNKKSSEFFNGEIEFDLEGLIMQPIKLDGGRLIGQFPLDQLFILKTSNEKNENQLSALVSEMDESSNPVIVIYHLKEEWK